MSRAWKGGSTRAWRKLRAYVLERDGYACQKLDDDGRPCGKPATDAGHITPLDVTGGPILVPPSELEAQCTKHNRGEGARLGNAKRSRPSSRGWAW